MEKWKGFREAVVWKKEQENDHIASLYIKVEGEEGDLPPYEPGQFISIRVPVDGGLSKARQYTLSTASNGEYYKISVKREAAGDVSKLLCDQVEEGSHVMISAPAGKFVLKEGTKPILLIGGGIGITPMLTMAMEAAHTNRETHLIYQLPNSEFLAFEEEIADIKKKNPNLKVTLVFTRPLAEDEHVPRYNHKGRLNEDWMNQNINTDSEAYLCGPVEFMRAMYQFLSNAGVPKEDIHYELFQAGADITK